MKIGKRRLNWIIEARLLGKPDPIRVGDWVVPFVPPGQEAEARRWGVSDLAGKIARVLGGLVNSPRSYFGFVAVRFREEMSFLHGCNGRCAMHHGWYIPPKFLRIIINRPQFNKSNKGGAQ